MDMIQTGKFIAQLRKENGLTQEQLGEKIGVTNKTISRWETGTYLPPADALLTMSELFSVSINEMLSGKKLLPEEYKAEAENNLVTAIRISSFEIKEKTEYFKKKWLKEHTSIMVIIGICIVSLFIIGFAIKESLISTTAVLLLVPAHGWRYNTMMAYVEKHIYDKDELS